MKTINQTIDISLSQHEAKELTAYLDYSHTHLIDLMASNVTISTTDSHMQVANKLSEILHAVLSLSKDKKD